MFRAAQAEDVNATFTVESARESEINLIKKVLDYEAEVLKAASAYSPAIIIAYALQLAKAFNRLYNDVSILKESNVELRRFRLKLAGDTAATIKQCLSLIGMQCPERM
jgi:arginyl-tRNA synthetase